MPVNCRSTIAIHSLWGSDMSLVLSTSIIVKSNPNVSTHFRHKHMRAQETFLTLMAIWSNLVHRYSWVLWGGNWIGLCELCRVDDVPDSICTYSIGKYFHLSSHKTIKPARAGMLAHWSNPDWHQSWRACVPLSAVLQIFAFLHNCQISK